MLSIYKFKVSFIDNETGEIIRKYEYQDSKDSEKLFDVSELLTDTLLVKFMQSFRRGCRQKRNLSLHLDFETNEIF